MKFLTARQIKAKFFKKNSEVTELVILEGLKVLMDEGMIKQRKVESIAEELFTVTKSGRDQLQTLKPQVKLPQEIQRFFPFGINHDLLLIDLRIRFEELKFLTRWYSEQSLKEQPFFLRAFTDLPDAVCKKKNGKSYFLELEVSKKPKSQYQERIEEYLKHLENEKFQESEIEGVIFFCTDPKVKEIIKSCIPEKEHRISILLYSRYFQEKTNAI